MPNRRASFTFVTGPHEGDTVQVEVGSCRLVGRHLSDSETVLLDKHGNRVLEPTAADLVEQQLQEKTPDVRSTPPPVAHPDAFSRSADIVLADDSISRAHAMIFFDKQAVGIIDLASTNGTWVNGERTGTIMLNDGDEIVIGGSQLAVSIR